MTRSTSCSSRAMSFPRWVSCGARPGVMSTVLPLLAGALLTAFGESAFLLFVVALTGIVTTLRWFGSRPSHRHAAEAQQRLRAYLEADRRASPVRSEFPRQVNR